MFATTCLACMPHLALEWRLKQANRSHHSRGLTVQFGSDAESCSGLWSKPWLGELLR